MYIAYNLDGGGSSTMYFNGRVVNKPANGDERPVYDAIVLLMKTTHQNNNNTEATNIEKGATNAGDTKFKQKF